MPASLRARLALAFTLVVAISLFVAAGILVAVLHGYSSRLVEARLDDVASIVFIQARGMLQNGRTPAEVLDFLAEQADRLEVRILLLDRQGRVLREAGEGSSLLGLRIPLEGEVVPGPGRQPIHGRFTSPRDQGTYQYSALAVGLPTAGAGVSGVLAVAQPEGSFMATLGSLIPQLGIAAGAGLLAGLIAAVLLARWLGRPLARLLVATRAMARGDFAQRVPLAGPRELVRLSESFNTMAGETERSRRIVRRFVGTLSHELRTPLTSIRGFAQAVRDGSVSKPEEVQYAMRVVDREARRMQRLSAELLDLSRLQAGQVPMRREQVDLVAVVRQCTEVLATLGQQQQVQVQLELPSSLCVQGDADRLEQVFTNLIENALKFTRANAVVHVRAELHTTASAALVLVTNPGQPIPPEELRLIFQQFYTGSEARERGGSGLGLPVAREIVLAHGGDITVESGPESTTFCVQLPRAPFDTRP